MKKTVFYPYLGEQTKVFAAFVEYEIVDVITLPGSGFEEKDSGKMLLLDESGVIVHTDFAQAMDHCDAVLLAETISKPYLFKKILPSVKIAVAQKKEILCAAELSPEQHHELSQIASDMVYLPSLRPSVIPHHDAFSEHNPAICQLHKPVLMVGGLFGFAEEFEITALLTSTLRKKGLKVSGVLASYYSSLMGLHAYPDFLVQPGTLNDSQRIIEMNHYLTYLCKIERPDVMVLQLPDGLMKFNDILPNSFGVQSFLLSQSTQCDYFICCAPNDFYGQEFWKAISQKMHSRFGFPIDQVHLSNKTIYYAETMENKKFLTYRVPLQRSGLSMQKAVKDNDIPVDNLLCDNLLENIVDNMFC